MERRAFFLTLGVGSVSVDPKAYTQAFYCLAKHLPGLGGRASFDELEGDEVLQIAEHLREDQRREAAAIRNGRTTR